MNECPNHGSGSVLPPWLPRITALSTTLVLIAPALTLQCRPLPSAPGSPPVAHVTSLLGCQKLSQTPHIPGTRSPPLPAGSLLLPTSSPSSLPQETGHPFFSLPGPNTGIILLAQTSRQCTSKSVSPACRCVQNSPSCRHLHLHSCYPSRSHLLLVPVTAF